MSNWPFPAQRQNSDQLDRLHKAATIELEQGISREITARVEAAESRAATFERECARLAEENAMLRERCRRMVEMHPELFVKQISVAARENKHD